MNNEQTKSFFQLEKEEVYLKIHNMSRLLNILILANITTFIGTGLVYDFKYWFPLIALTLFFIVAFFLTLPSYKMKSVQGYWCLFLTFWFGIIFTMISFVYMVTHHDFSIHVK